MKTLDSIPTHKMERVGKLVSTGIKVGGNYLKFYGKNILQGESDREALNEANAKDIYDGLKTLKGSALKVAQMLSMEKNLLPKAYVEQFGLSQFSVPPLSSPLVSRLIKKYLGAPPEELFDTFATQSVNAASIGQVHKATKNGKKLAVKIQYPGVANSIGSDLAIVKPIAERMFNIRGKATEKYFKEVESKLLEETDYTIELNNSQYFASHCAHIPNLCFPEYYSNWSNQKILTMDWMEGLHLSEYCQLPENKQENNNKIGQTLWDFYMVQMHKLKKVQADPHPGNFLVTKDHELVALDFGCVKSIPNDFYIPYFELSKPENIKDQKKFESLLFTLEILKKEDTPQEKTFFTTLFKDMMMLFTKPFHQDTFDFADSTFWDAITNLSKTLTENPQIKKLDGNRGVAHFIYMNRTFFGLYHLLHDLNAQVKTNNYITVC
ncbi:MAG: ABC1 kinase family protein [Flavobacteriaceae bacterium]